jgi:hypothetical protein
MTTATNNLLQTEFIDRRASSDPSQSGFERRQFGNTHHGLSPDARELAEAIDSYKVAYRRRYITFEEMLAVIHELGYSKA